MNKIKYLLLLLLLIITIACKSTKMIFVENKIYIELDSLDYFIYSSSEGKNKIRSLDLEKYLSTNSIIEYYDDSNLEPVTKRVYQIDGEYLSDRGGIERFLVNELKPFCKASGFKLELRNHKVLFDTTKFIRTEEVEINNENYKIFIGDNTRSGEGVYLAPIRIGRMINNELRIQELDERFYLINSGNDLAGAFLTKSQYEFFKNNIKDDYWQPQTIEDWIKLYNIKIKS